MEACGQTDGARYFETHFPFEGRPEPVVGPGDFVFAAMSLEHGHIYGMCESLIEAGASLKWVYEPDPVRLQQFCAHFPQARAASSEAEILEDDEVKLVAAAAVTSERCALGIRVMEAGKDYFTDKAPMTTLEQLALARAKVAETGRKYMVYYSERIRVEAAVYAGQLLRQGAVGRVIQVIGLGPHSLRPQTRPEWFFDRERYGGILVDIGSHQIEQFLYYSGAEDARVLKSQVGNYQHPEYPGLEDFGDAMLLGDNGASQYFRVDWFTPTGLRTWGDGRSFILGTDGYIELRKYINIAEKKSSNHVYLVNGDGEFHMDVSGRVGYPFFGALILDCLNRTEHAMTQAHAFKAAELCIQAQQLAEKRGFTPPPGPDAAGIPALRALREYR